jgi:hypothetical protein
MMPVQSLQSTAASLAKSLSRDISLAEPSSRKYIGDDNIDAARVRALYKAHCGSFWSLIASEYSHNSAFSGRQLEEAFFPCQYVTDNRSCSFPSYASVEPPKF